MEFVFFLLCYCPSLGVLHVERLLLVCPLAELFVVHLLVMLGTWWKKSEPEQATWTEPDLNRNKHP